MNFPTPDEFFAKARKAAIDFYGVMFDPCECDACLADVETPPIDYVSVMDQAAEAGWGDMADDFI